MLPKTCFKRPRKFSQNHRSLVGFESKWPLRLFSLVCSFGNSASGNQVPAIAVTFSETIRYMLAWLRYKCLFPLEEKCIFKNNLSSFDHGRSDLLCESPFSGRWRATTLIGMSKATVLFGTILILLSWNKLRFSGQLILFCLAWGFTEYDTSTWN